MTEKAQRMILSVVLAIAIGLALIGITNVFGDVDAEPIGTFYDTDYNVQCYTYKSSIDCVYIAPDDRMDNGEANVLLPR